MERSCPMCDSPVCLVCGGCDSCGTCECYETDLDIEEDIEENQDETDE
jgi:hypothetical protein